MKPVIVWDGRGGLVPLCAATAQATGAVAPWARGHWVSEGRGGGREVGGVAAREAGDGRDLQPRTGRGGVGRVSRGR